LVTFARHPTARPILQRGKDASIFTGSIVGPRARRNRLT
jgi:hypothetical protein